jgi:hypothetical protein
MGTPAQVGKSEWKAAVTGAKVSRQTLLAILKKINCEGGPVVRALAGQAAMELLELSSHLDRLEEIGRNCKDNPSQ